MLIYGPRRRGLIRVAAAAGLLLALPGCGGTPPPAAARLADPAPAPAPIVATAVAFAPKEKPRDRGADTIGTASWYGSFHHGRKTASGVRFDRNALTAAHRSLAFGTKVEVTNLSNSKSVVLTVNDRGPYVGGRIIDVSEQAARSLGFREAGLAQVRVRVLTQMIE